jgi:hypothetical protein
MAKVQFDLRTKSKSKRHITLDDCSDGDIVYLEEDNAFGIVSDSDYAETEVTHFSSGAREWFPSSTPCRKFIGEINFDVNDFEEFI